jgi:hypothetical protein
MNRLTLAFLLLSFCSTSSVAGAVPQSDRQASGEDTCRAGFKECQEGLNDSKEAVQFMQLKATVLADLELLEKSRATKPKIAPVRGAHVISQKTRNRAVDSAAVGENKKLSMHATSTVQPVSLESAAGPPEQ